MTRRTPSKPKRTRRPPGGREIAGGARPDARAVRRRARGGGPSASIAIAISIAVLVVGGVLWQQLRHAARLPARSALPRAALADNLKRAARAKDWKSVVRWSEELSRVLPRNSLILTVTAAAWHNLALGGPRRSVLPRPALRTSLERIANEVRAIAISESAQACATTLGEWIQPAIGRAQVYDFLGLSGEALETYRAVARRDPHNVPVRVHLLTIEALLRDPTLPDSTRLPARLAVP